MNDLNSQLKELYLKLGLYIEPLHLKCINSDTCWYDVSTENICGNNEEESQLYRPYIGEDYQIGRVLAIGINMHKYGGYNAENILAEKAKNEIRKGKKRTFAKKGYRGSLVWHRMLSYSSFILREVGVFEIPEKRPYPKKIELTKAFDYISITNSIKCCPWHDRSKPTNEMWKHCPDYILKEEIRILKPRHLIILGIDNYHRVKNLFDDRNEKHKGDIKFVKAKFEGEDIYLYAFPHPASSQGTSLKRMDELEILLMDEHL